MAGDFSRQPRTHRQRKDSILEVLRQRERPIHSLAPIRRRTRRAVLHRRCAVRPAECIHFRGVARDFPASHYNKLPVEPAGGSAPRLRLLLYHPRSRFRILAQRRACGVGARLRRQSLPLELRGSASAGRRDQRDIPRAGRQPQARAVYRRRQPQHRRTAVPAYLSRLHGAFFGQLQQGYRSHTHFQRPCLVPQTRLDGHCGPRQAQRG